MTSEPNICNSQLADTQATTTNTTTTANTRNAGGTTKRRPRNKKGTPTDADRQSTPPLKNATPKPKNSKARTGGGKDQRASITSSPSSSADDKPTGCNFSGSSFHHSPNAATLPRPPFAKPASPPSAPAQPSPAVSAASSRPPPFVGQPFGMYPHPQMPHFMYPGMHMASPPMGYPMGYPMGPPPMMAAPMQQGGYFPPPAPMNLNQPSGN